MHNKYFQIIKVFLVLVVSYGCTRLVGYLFFPNNSPQISISRVEYLAKIVKENPQGLLALFNQKAGTGINTDDLSTFKKISKGVYAKEENGKTVTVIKQNEMDMVEYSYVIDEKPISIRVPVGSISKEEMEKVLIEMKTYKQVN